MLCCRRPPSNQPQFCCKQDIGPSEKLGCELEFTPDRPDGGPGAGNDRIQRYLLYYDRSALLQSFKRLSFVAKAASTMYDLSSQPPSPCWASHGSRSGSGIRPAVSHGCSDKALRSARPPIRVEHSGPLDCGVLSMVGMVKTVPVSSDQETMFRNLCPRIFLTDCNGLEGRSRGHFPRQKWDGTRASQWHSFRRSINTCFIWTQR